MSLGYVPYLPPGALLFTAVVWRHLLNGASSEDKSVEEIYGHIGGRKRNLFGERVKFSSVAVFGGSLTPEEVLLRHTHFGIYSRALTRHTADSWASDIIGGHRQNGYLPGPLQRYSPLEMFPLATSSLRSCKACIAQDVDELGFASWHILHTLPPVHHCPYHGTALIAEMEGRIGRKLWPLRLPTGVSIDRSAQHFESASDGYVEYLRLWINLLDGSLPVVAADSWADYMDVAAERMGSVESAIAELSDQVRRSWGVSPHQLPEILGPHVHKDFIRLELEHRSTSIRLAQKLIILGACDLLGVTRAKNVAPEQLAISLRTNEQDSPRASREELIRIALSRAGIPLAIASGLASGLAASLIARITGVHRHRVNRAISGFSESTLEELSSLGTWQVDSWLAKELVRRGRR